MYAPQIAILINAKIFMNTMFSEELINYNIFYQIA